MTRIKILEREEMNDEQGRVYDAAKAAGEIGYPVLMKAAAGGGGRGIKIVTGADGLADAFGTASSEARGAFGDDTLYMERYIANARHVEVQVLGDAHGNVVHLFERDCSVQRRHQKVIETAPAAWLEEDRRAEICATAVRLARAAFRGEASLILWWDLAYLLTVSALLLAWARRSVRQRLTN